MNFKPNFIKKEEQGSKIARASRFEPVTKYMATDLITFTPETEIIKVIDIMLEKKISGAPILNENKELVGLISEKDCLKVLIDSVYHNQPISKYTVENFMTTRLTTISDQADVIDVANEFLKGNFKRFPVVDENGRLVGQVSRRDILKAIKAMNVTTWFHQ